MMVDVWRVKDRWSFEFVRVQAERLTDASVFIGGSRVALPSDGVRYFTTFDDAKNYAIERLSQKAQRARREMESAEEHLRHIESVTNENIAISTGRW